MNVSTTIDDEANRQQLDITIGKLVADIRYLFVYGNEQLRADEIEMLLDLSKSFVKTVETALQETRKRIITG